MKYATAPIFAICLLFQHCTQPQKSSEPTVKKEADFYSAADFYTVKKTDAHVHLYTNKTDFDTLAEADNFSLVTITLDDINEPPPMEVQQEFALEQIKAFPDRVAYATTISVRNFNSSSWQQEAIAYLKNSFAKGAVAAKIYKVIGMALKDKAGKLVMIDDPRFDPVIDFIVKNNIPVLGHLGEPKNCWLPLDKMTIKGDKTYYKDFPVYHMYLHPEFPSYEDQIAARDRFIKKHPDLKFIGAHLGSLEWSVDELAKRLDEFPNMAVDMAARISHLQFQSVSNRQKVRDFIIKYQDRLLYATDDVVTNASNVAEMKAGVHETWIKDWQFFTSRDTMTSRDFDGSFASLQLPKKVVDKIYRENAERWYPGMRFR